MIGDTINLGDGMIAMEVDSNPYNCFISKENPLQFEYIVRDSKISKNPAYTFLFLPKLPDGMEYKYLSLRSQIAPSAVKSLLLDNSKEYALFRINIFKAFKV